MKETLIPICGEIYKVKLSSGRTCLTTNKKNRGKCLIGVYEYKKGKFVSTYHREYLGVSKNQEDLFFRYKEKKEEYLKSLAEKYKDKISNDAYNALYRYQIDIND